MDKVANQAQDYLTEIFNGLGLDLHATAAEDEAGCTLNIDGDDAVLLRSEGGELLDALEHFVNQAFGRQLPHGQRLVCDVDSFRATREAELRAMARHAAERVRSSRVPFTFGPMNASERRVIHLTLAEEEDLHTESVGEGNARRLQVSLKS
ncbi:MAG TPA: R3H domain-containing nucleic acid-binding protein [Pyrinomonadaceae bacterium]|nr:R3H domain-containing nucleic acid-binding protein [Pyrinomonadaceae bacterium]